MTHNQSRRTVLADREGFEPINAASILPHVALCSRYLKAKSAFCFTTERKEVARSENI